MLEEEDGPSKSALKRQMTALQKIGEQLVALSPRELKTIPIDDDALLLAIEETHRIRSNSARRRHLQYIGKLMRKLDAGPIEAALAELYQRQRGENDAFHELESLRDRLIDEGPGALEVVLERFPDTDRQHLRQLLRQHQREVSRGKPTAAKRKIFKYLRELSEAG
jgi:ribosome-associated protein